MSKVRTNDGTLAEGFAPVEYSLLGLLDERPLHGYELHHELSLKTGLGLVWTVGQAQLYAILGKLEARGLVSAELVAQEGRPAKRVFRLTREGRSLYKAWLEAPSARRDFRLDFLAKLFFARKRGGSAVGSLVAKQRELCAAWVEDLRSREKAQAGEGMDGIVFRYRIGQLEATLAWLDDCARGRAE